MVGALPWKRTDNPTSIREGREWPPFQGVKALTL
jgi:hypothetical protein